MNSDNSISETPATSGFHNSFCLDSPKRTAMNCLAFMLMLQLVLSAAAQNGDESPFSLRRAVKVATFQSAKTTRKDDWLARE